MNKETRQFIWGLIMVIGAIHGMFSVTTSTVLEWLAYAGFVVILYLGLRKILAVT